MLIFFALKFFKTTAKCTCNNIIALITHSKATLNIKH